VLSIGGIDVKTSHTLGQNLDIATLRKTYDAVFVGMGLAGVNKLGLEGEGKIDGVVDAVAYIAELRQAKDLSKLPVGRHVVVIGGGMTAIDIAVQSKKLGAESVTVVYRRGQDDMKASGYEQELAQTNGVVIRTFAQPASLHSENGKIKSVTFDETEMEKWTSRINWQTVHTASGYALHCDRSNVCAGWVNGADALAIDSGRIKVDAERRTSVKGIGPVAIVSPVVRISPWPLSKMASRLALSIHRALSA